MGRMSDHHHYQLQILADTNRLAVEAGVHPPYPDVPDPPAVGPADSEWLLTAWQSTAPGLPTINQQLTAAERSDLRQRAKALQDEAGATRLQSPAELVYEEVDFQNSGWAHYQPANITAPAMSDWLSPRLLELYNANKQQANKQAVVVDDSDSDADAQAAKALVHLHQQAAPPAAPPAPRAAPAATPPPPPLPVTGQHATTPQTTPSRPKRSKASPGGHAAATPAVPAVASPVVPAAKRARGAASPATPSLALVAGTATAGPMSPSRQRAPAATAIAVTRPAGSKMLTGVLKKVGTSRQGKRFARRQIGAVPRWLPNTHIPITTQAEVQLFFKLRHMYTKGGKVDFARMALA